MTDPQPTVEQHTTTPNADKREEQASFPWGRVVWGIVALGFVGYLVFGTVSARIWRFNRLYFEDRRILEIWRYEVNNLPDVPTQGALTLLYYGSVVVLIGGVVLGLWYLLDETGFRDSTHTAPSDHRPTDHA